MSPRFRVEISPMSRKGKRAEKTVFHCRRRAGIRGAFFIPEDLFLIKGIEGTTLVVLKLKPTN